MHTAKQYTYRPIHYMDLGLIDYKTAWDLQHKLFDQRVKNEIEDTLLLLEHNPTYTLGKIADKKNLIGTEEFMNKNKISVYEIDRGGDITYHGPGQIVGYPIIDLKLWHQDTHQYLRALEEVIINVCQDFGLDAGRNVNHTGVWIKDRKICAIGVKISRWVTMHGFAFNVNTDLSMFNGIVPCGIKDKEVTSLKKELGTDVSMNRVKEIIVDSFITVFNYSEVINERKNPVLN